MPTQSIELDLSTVVPSLSGPKRPHDRVSLSEMKEDFQKCLDNKVSSCHSNFCVNFEKYVQNNKILRCDIQLACFLIFGASAVF